MSAVFDVTRDQIGLFDQPAKQASAPLVVDKTEANELPAIEEGEILFDASGWYATPEKLKKLNALIAKLTVGQRWINGHGVTVTYLGLTQTGEKLHQDVAGVHVYVKPKPQSIPQKKYPIKGEDNTPRFTLERQS